MGESVAEGYTVKELADRAGVTPRTVYYYVSEGLLPPPEGGGPATTYRDEHLARLRLIRRLKDEYLPLAEIRRRLAGLSQEEVAGLVAAPRPAPPRESARAYLARILGSRDVTVREASPSSSPTSAAPKAEPGRAEQRAPARPRSGSAGPAARGPSPHEVSDALPVEQADWRRVRIGPDLELHVRRDASPAIRKNLNRIVEAIRRLMTES